MQQREFCTIWIIYFCDLEKKSKILKSIKQENSHKTKTLRGDDLSVLQALISMCVVIRTRSWRSWSSRRLCIWRRHGDEASKRTAWWKVFQKHTAGHQRGRLPSSSGRVGGCHPSDLAQWRGRSTYDQYWVRTRRDKVWATRQQHNNHHWKKDTWFLLLVIFSSPVVQE